MRQHSGVGVLDKSVHLLEVLADGPLSLAELTTRSRLPRATAHRLATALGVHGLVSLAPDGRYYLGSRLAELAAQGAQDLLLQRAGPVLQALQQQTGESTQLYRRRGDGRVCIATAEPPSGLRDTVPVGAVLPLTAGSGAQVLLAWNEDPAALRTLLAGAAFSDRTLAQVRQRGWAVSIGEREPGVGSVSAPVRDAQGRVVAAISVSGPLDRLGRSPGARLSPALLAAAAALSG